MVFGHQRQKNVRDSEGSPELNFAFCEDSKTQMKDPDERQTSVLDLANREITLMNLTWSTKLPVMDGLVVLFETATSRTAKYWLPRFHSSPTQVGKQLKRLTRQKDLRLERYQQ